MASDKFTTSNYDLFSYGKIEVGVVRQEENRPIVILDPDEGIRLYTSSGAISEGEGRFQLKSEGGTMIMRGKDAVTGDYDRQLIKLEASENSGQLALFDNQGKKRIELHAGERELILYDSNGTRTIRLNGEAGTIYGSNADLAENFACWQEHKDYEPGSDGWAEITDPIKPGDVLVISADGKLVKSPPMGYNTCVAGVVSGAKDYKPGIILDDVDVPDTQESYDGEGTFPVALAGKVYCNVIGDIQAGDLLVTAEKHKGVAMKADPRYRDKWVGAILGKALKSVRTSTVVQIPILVMLG